MLLACGRAGGKGLGPRECAAHPSSLFACRRHRIPRDSRQPLFIFGNFHVHSCFDPAKKLILKERASNACCIMQKRWFWTGLWIFKGPCIVASNLLWFWNSKISSGCRASGFGSVGKERFIMFTVMILEYNIYKNDYLCNISCISYGQHNTLSTFYKISHFFLNYTYHCAPSLRFRVSNTLVFL